MAWSMKMMQRLDIEIIRKPKEKVGVNPFLFALGHIPMSF